MTTLGLKNVNMLSKEQYNEIAVPAEDELYAISGSGFGFPSGNYIELVLGASGTEYTAPANGYYYIGKNVTAWQYFQIQNDTKGYSVRDWSSAGTIVFLAPVTKGDIVKVVYNAAGATDLFKFIYAEGE